MSRATHVNDPSQLEIQPGIPPSGGPHFPTWVRGGGEYPEPVNDGQVIHSLEHGYIWISYNPDLVTEDDLEVLREVTNRHQRDVILSPRPENALPIAAVSWGRLLRMDSADGDLLDEFVRTNRNNAPEPGIRP